MISVVIPAYNRRDCLLALLADLFRQEDAAFEVIVVDDASSDDTVDAVRRQFPQVTLLINEVNGGPAVSRNRGVRAAHGEFIVGFDSDVTVPDPRFLAKVEASFAEHPSVCGLAFHLLQPDGITEDAPRWWHPLPIGKFADRRFLTSYFSGTGYAFRRESMLAAGLFPEILYMHYEEVELAFRVLDNGGSILHAPHLKILHHASEVSRQGRVRVFYKPRNQILLTLRCYPLLRGLSYVLPRMGYGLLQACRHRHLTDFWRALRSTCQLAPACLRQRKVLASATWRRLREHKRRPLEFPSALPAPSE